MNKHRIVEVTGNHLDISDTVNLMAGRAIGVMSLIALQFESDDVSRVSNEHLVNAVNSVICELGDIQAYIKAQSLLGTKTGTFKTENQQSQ